MAISPSGATVWRDYVTDGVPASGDHKVRKDQVRAWSEAVETRLDAVSTAAKLYETRAALYADLTEDANTLAWVYGDATTAYNGVYMKSGASGSGSWSRVGDLPYSFIVASDAGAGTSNAIQATTSIPVSESALVLLNVFEANTGSPVTVSFNGGSALTIKTNSGNDVTAGGLVSGILMLGRVSGSTFRLVSDQVAAGIVAQAEDAADRAEAAAAIAMAAQPNSFAATRTVLKAVDTSQVTNAYLKESGRVGQFAWVSGDLSSLVSADTLEGIYIAPASDPTGASGAWVRQRDTLDVNVKWFGAKGDFDGTTGTDDKAAIQAAIDIAKLTGAAKVLFPPGRYQVASTGLNLTQTAYTTTIGSAVALVGAGSLGAILEYTGGGTGTCLEVIGGFRIEGIALRGRGAAANRGTGLIWKQSPWSEIKDVRISGFTLGLDMRDVFCLNMSYTKIFANLRGWNAARESESFGSDPNAFTLTQVTIQGNTHYGANFTKPVTLVWIGGSVEGNGKDTAFTSRYGLYIANAGHEGAVGAAFYGVYFEGNAGKADVWIDHVLYNCAYLFSGCTFNRISATEYVTNPILVDKGAASLVLNFQGNGFTSNGVYTPDSGRKAIQVNIASGNNIKIVGEGTNLYASDLERPSFPCVVADADGMVRTSIRCNAAGGIVSQSGNVLSVTKGAAGTYTINFKSALRTATHFIAGSLLTQNGTIRLAGETSSSVTILVVVAGAATDADFSLDITSFANI